MGFGANILGLTMTVDYSNCGESSEPQAALCFLRARYISVPVTVGGAAVTISRRFSFRFGM
jgi:hypothetical protein